MNCPDVRDLLFGELDDVERRRLREHVDACSSCHLEYERLSLTAAALRAAPEEEPLSRIRFVSDRVFDRPWWQRIPQGAAALWAHAALAIPTCAAVAVLLWTQSHPGRSDFASTNRPILETPSSSVHPVSLSSSSGPLTAAEVHRLVEDKVAQALAEADRRHTAEVKTLVADFHRQQLHDQQLMVSQIQDVWRYQDHMKQRALLAAYEKPATEGN